MPKKNKYIDYLPNAPSFSDQCFEGLMADVRKGMKRKKNVKVCR